MAAQAQTQPQTAPANGPDAAARAPQKSKNFELLELIASQSIGMSQDYTRQLVEVEIERARFDQQYRLATAFANSGMFAEIKNKSHEEALATAQAKIEMGRSWNMSAGDAMQFVYFVNGRPAIQNEYYAGAIMRAGYWWDVKWDGQAKACKGCTLFLKTKNDAGEWARVKNADGSDASASFTEDDMQAAGLDKKDTYKAWKQDMFFWRAMARLRKWYCPNILGGTLMVAEAQDLDAIADETERQRTEGPIVLQAPKVKTPPPAPEPTKPATEPPTVQDLGFAPELDPNATVTDERAEEVKEAMQAAGWTRKQAEKLWSDLGVNNAYGLTNKKADLALATIAGKEAVVTSH